MAGAADKPFVGNAWARVQPSGRVRLPDFARRVLQRHPSSIFVGLHPDAPCLIAFDSRYVAHLTEQLARAPEGREEAASEALDRIGRMRRVFGTAEEIGWPCDTIRLPDHPRRCAGIDQQALFVGFGGAMEIWDPGLAAQSGDETLEALGAWRLAQNELKGAPSPASKGTPR